MAINIIPNLGTYKRTGMFRFWCQHVLPLVYDDSLSYYELLCKVVKYLNDVIENLDTAEDNITELSNAFIELQEYVNNYFDSLDVEQKINDKLDEMASDGSLAQALMDYVPYITPELFGAVGDGVTDDSLAFDSAIAECLAKKTPLHLYEKDYMANNVTATELPSIIGNGGTVRFGQHQFVYSDNFSVKDVTFISYFASDKTQGAGSFLRPVKLNTNWVEMKNVTFNAIRNSDTLRGYIFIRLANDYTTMQNIRILGSWSGIIFNNNANITPDRYYIDNVYGENIQTLIDFEGYTNPADMSGWVENVTISNVMLVNTAEQQANYTQIVGSDCMLMSNVKNLTIDNIFSNYATERGVYLVNVQGCTITNVTVNRSEGIKIAGTQLSQLDPTLSGYILSENINMNNIRVYQAHNGYCMLFYQVHGISASDIVFENQSDVSPYYGIGMTGVTSNVYIDGVRGFNSARGLIYIYTADGWQNNVAKIGISNVDFDNPVNVSKYKAIRIEGSSSIFAHDITFDNVRFNRNKDMYKSDASLTGLIGADWVEDLVIKDCQCKEFDNLGTGITIGDHCGSVTVIGDYECSSAIVACDFKCTHAMFNLFANTVRNVFNVIQRYNKLLSSLAIPTPTIIEFDATLLYRAPQYLFNPVNDYAVEMVSNEGYLKGHSTGGTFAIEHSSGSFGTSSGNIRFDPSTLAVECYKSGGGSTVHGQIIM